MKKKAMKIAVPVPTIKAMKKTKKKKMKSKVVYPDFKSSVPKGKAVRNQKKEALDIGRDL